MGTIKITGCAEAEKLCEEAGDFIRADHCVRITSRNVFGIHGSVDRVAFLFKNMIVFAKEKKDAYEYKRHYNINDLQVVLSKHGNVTLYQEGHSNREHAKFNNFKAFDGKKLDEADIYDAWRNQVKMTQMSKALCNVRADLEH